MANHSFPNNHSIYGLSATSFALPWITDNKEVLKFLTKYQDYLQFTKGGFGSIVVQSLSWG